MRREWEGRLAEENHFEVIAVLEGARKGARKEGKENWKKAKRKGGRKERSMKACEEQKREG